MIGAGGLAAVGMSLGFGPKSKDIFRKLARPKNIIFCVVDGMPLQVMAMTDHFRQIRDGKRSYWSTLLDEPYAFSGLQDTRSLNSLVTDSSAASSAWGSGRRIWNGQLNMYPDGTELRTLYQLTREKGVRRGLVTTTRITHATPAGFAVNCIGRDLEGLIAEKYLSLDIDVLLGGGDRFFNPAKRPDKKDLYAEFRSGGYTIVKDKTALKTATGKLLGVFDASHVPYTVDRIHTPELDAKVPTIAEMAAKAISLLEDSQNGFILQIEGGRVDHGGHSNDLAAMIYDQIEFEDAMKVAVDFALEDGETLVIMTADHACGGASLNGAGEEYIASTAGLESVSKMKASYDTIFRKIGRTPQASDVSDAVKEFLTIELKPDEAEAVAKAAEGNSPFRLGAFMNGVYPALATVLGNHTKVTFTSGNHTNEHVLVSAVGPGGEACAGLTENISFFDLMCSAYEIEHRNPVMSFEEAKKHHDKMKGRAAEARERYAELDAIDLAHHIPG